MKKILSIFSSLSLVVVGSTTVVACGNGNTAKASLLPTLNEVAIQLNVGIFNATPSEEQLINGLATINDLDATQLEITLDANRPNFAKVSVKADSTIYAPSSVEIIYRDPDHMKLPLSVEYKVTNIGKAYMLRIFSTDSKTNGNYSSFEGSLINQLIYTNIKTSPFKSGNMTVNAYDAKLGTATISAGSDSEFYSPSSINIKYEFIEKRGREIDDDKTNYNMGKLGGIKKQLTAENVINQFERVNRNIVPGQVSIFNRDFLTSGKMNNDSIYLLVNYDSTIYTPSALIYAKYTYNELKPLSDDVKIVNLGSFTKEPTFTEIIKRLEEKNTSTQKGEYGVAIKEETKATIAVSEFSQNYLHDSTVEVSWTIG